jgi:integrase
MTLNAIKRLNYQEEINLGRGVKARGNKDGSASFLFSMKMKGLSSPIRMKLGTWPDISIDDAEDKARIYRAKVAEGIHPKDYETGQAELKLREEADAKSQAMTVWELLVWYENIKEIDGKPNADRTITDRRWGIKSVFSEWVEKPAIGITKQVVLNKIFEWSSQRGSKSQVIKVCEYMSAIWNLAITMDLLEINPFEVRKGRFNRRGKKVIQYMQIDECKSLIKWINILHEPVRNATLIAETFGGEDEYSVTVKVQRQLQYDAIALTLLTGLRKLEVLSLKWSQVHLTISEWGTSKGAFFDFMKSKQQEPMGIPITEQMMPYFESCLSRIDAFKRINEKRSDKNKHLYNLDYLFPSVRAGEAITTTKSAFDQLNIAIPNLEKAEKVGAQVLRRTFATTAYSLGYTMEQIGLFTGHTSAVANNNVATDAYVARQADAHREGFETINSALVGDTHVDLVPLPIGEAGDWDALNKAETWDERIAVLNEGIEDLSTEGTVEGTDLSPRELREILVDSAIIASGKLGQKDKWSTTEIRKARGKK